VFIDEWRECQSCGFLFLPVTAVTCLFGVRRGKEIALVRITLEFRCGCHISQVKYGFSYGQAHCNPLSVPMDLVCGEDKRYAGYCK
jgi:hypothetical protein